MRGAFTICTQQGLYQVLLDEKPSPQGRNGGGVEQGGGQYGYK